MGKGEFKEKIKNDLILILIFLVMLVLVTAGYAFSKGGFDELFIQGIFGTYMAVALGSSIIILICRWYLIYIVNSKEYGDSVLFNSQGERPSVLPFLKKISLTNMIAGSFITSAILSYFIILNQQKRIFADPTIILQQFTALESNIFSILLIPIAEGLALSAFLAIIRVVTVRMAIKGKWGIKQYVAIMIIIMTIASGIFGVLNHKSVYVKDEELTGVASFWGISGSVIAMTGSNVPITILHVVNNATLKMQGFYSNDQIVIALFMIIFASFIVLIWPVISKIIFVLANKLFGRKGVKDG